METFFQILIIQVKIDLQEKVALIEQIQQLKEWYIFLIFSRK